MREYCLPCQDLLTLLCPQERPGGRLPSLERRQRPERPVLSGCQEIAAGLSAAGRRGPPSRGRLPGAPVFQVTLAQSCRGNWGGDRLGLWVRADVSPATGLPRSLRAGSLLAGIVGGMSACLHVFGGICIRLVARVVMVPVRGLRRPSCVSWGRRPCPVKAPASTEAQGRQHAACGWHPWHLSTQAVPLPLCVARI